jgi:hypothetical protein
MGEAGTKEETPTPKDANQVEVKESEVERTTASKKFSPEFELQGS